MGLFVLYLEELRALSRGRFVFFGLAGLFAFLGLIATLAGPEAGGSFVFLFLAYAVVPSSFAAFAAVQIAGPRASKFVHAVFTAPVRRASYFAAKVLVVLTVGVLYLLSTFPLWAVYALHIEIPESFYRFLLVGAGMILFGTGYGLFLGVVFTGRSLAAPVSLGVLPIFLTLALPFQAVGAGSPSELVREILGRVVRLSPQVNLLDALEVHPLGVPDAPGQSLALFLASTGALLVVAAWIYLVHQGVETWEGSAAPRAVAVLVGLAAILAPAFAPAMEYGPGEEGTRGGYRGDEGQGHILRALLVVPGARPDPDLFMPDRGGDPNLVLDLAARNEADLLVIFPPHEGTLTRVTIHARTGKGLDLEGGQNLVLDNYQPSEFVPLPDGPQRAFYVRVPVALEPLAASGLRGVHYRLTVWTNVTLSDPQGAEGGGPPTPHTEPGSFAFSVRGQFDDAELRVLPAAALPPVLFLTYGVQRAIRRR